MADGSRGILMRPSMTDGAGEGNLALSKAGAPGASRSFTGFSSPGGTVCSAADERHRQRRPVPQRRPDSPDRNIYDAIFCCWYEASLTGVLYLYCLVVS